MSVAFPVSERSLARFDRNLDALRLFAVEHQLLDVERADGFLAFRGLFFEPEGSLRGSLELQRWSFSLALTSFFLF